MWKIVNLEKLLVASCWEMWSRSFTGRALGRNQQHGAGKTFPPWLLWLLVVCSLTAVFWGVMIHVTLGQLYGWGTLTPAWAKLMCAQHALNSHLSLVKYAGKKNLGNSFAVCFSLNGEFGRSFDRIVLYRYLFDLEVIKILDYNVLNYLDEDNLKKNLKRTLRSH